jgi:chemotaxis response regulator CheB
VKKLGTLRQTKQGGSLKAAQNDKSCPKSTQPVPSSAADDGVAVSGTPHLGG